MYDSYATPIKRHMVWMMWFVLAATFLVVGIFLIGQATHDSNKAEHDRQMECMTAGGQMERIAGMGGIYCNHDHDFDND